MKTCRLLADIGGTNARFARSLPDGEILAKRNYRVADFPDFDSALQSYKADTGDFDTCDTAAIAAAGPVIDGQMRLTNADWQLSEAAISQSLGNVPTRLFNDLEAVALALPHLHDADLEPVGDMSKRPVEPSRMLALNVGTGFGAAVIIRCRAGWVTCPSEAGHMTFTAQDEVDIELPPTGGPAAITVEDVLSGAGLMRLYQSQCHKLGAQISATTPNEVFARVAQDAAAQNALKIFSGWLGRVARNLVLASAAWGGVFLTGGVIQGWRGVAPHCQFRKNFELDGKMHTLIRKTFVTVITRDECPLFGLARASID